MYNSFTVRVDGEEIGALEKSKELRGDGHTFTLPDGSRLTAKLSQVFIQTELHLLHNGQPLPDSMSDPVSRWKSAYQVVDFVGGLNIILGLIASFFQVELLLSLGLGVASLIFGVIIAALGYGTQQKLQIALILAVILLIADGVLGVFVALDYTGRPPTGGIIVRLLLLIPMIQGIPAISQMQNTATG